MVTTRVEQSVKAFDTLRKSDLVHARYTETTAVSVEKPWTGQCRDRRAPISS